MLTYLTDPWLYSELEQKPQILSFSICHPITLLEL